MTGLGIGAFVSLAGSVAGSDLSNQTPDPRQPWIDRTAIAYRIRHEILANRPRRSVLLQIVPWLSPAALVLVAVLIAATAYWRGQLRWVFTFGAVVLTAPLVRGVLKPVIDRRVPPATGAAALTFPSGHLTILGAVLMALFLLTQGTGVAFRTASAFTLACIALGFATVFTLTGNHFATDCIGGLLIGASFVSAADFVGHRVAASRIGVRER